MSIHRNSRPAAVNMEGMEVWGAAAAAGAWFSLQSKTGIFSISVRWHAKYTDLNKVITKKKSTVD